MLKRAVKPSVEHTSHLHRYCSNSSPSLRVATLYNSVPKIDGFLEFVHLAVKWDQRIWPLCFCVIFRDTLLVAKCVHFIGMSNEGDIAELKDNRFRIRYPISSNCHPAE
jgi:hypothetical protein